MNLDLHSGSGHVKHRWPEVFLDLEPVLGEILLWAVMGDFRDVSDEQDEIDVVGEDIFRASWLSKLQEIETCVCGCFLYSSSVFVWVLDVEFMNWVWESDGTL